MQNDPVIALAVAQHQTQQMFSELRRHHRHHQRASGRRTMLSRVRRVSAELCAEDPSLRPRAQKPRRAPQLQENAGAAKPAASRRFRPASFTSKRTTTTRRSPDEAAPRAGRGAAGDRLMSARGWRLRCRSHRSCARSRSASPPAGRETDAVETAVRRRAPAVSPETTMPPRPRPLHRATRTRCRYGRVYSEHSRADGAGPARGSLQVRPPPAARPSGRARAGPTGASAGPFRPRVG